MLRIENINNVFGMKQLSSSNECIGNSCIYASNGIFKTSFANFLFYLSRLEFDEIKERVLGKQPKYSLKIKGIDFDQNIDEASISEEQRAVLNDLVVYSSSIYKGRTLGSKDKLISLGRFELITGDIDLKKEFSKINTEINDISKLIEDSVANGLTMVQGEKLNAHFSDRVKSKNDIEKNIEIIKLALNVGVKEIDFVDWKDVTTKAFQNAVNNKEFIENAQIYSQVLNREIVSDIFDAKFNDLNFQELLSVLKTLDFINENRIIKIGETSFNSYNDFEKFLENKVESIKMNKNVIDAFNRMDKSLGTTAVADRIRNLLNDHKNIDVLSLGTDGMIAAKICDNIDYKELVEMQLILEEKQKALDTLLKKAGQIKTQFEHAIDVYKERFRPAFDVFVNDKIDSVLGIALPSVSFTHKDATSKTHNSYKVDENSILNILSSGESTVLKILHLIVECEAVKYKNPVVVIDDIVETFDYANRISTIEYLISLKEEGATIILMTHNFDFHRFAVSRLNASGNDDFNSFYGFRTPKGKTLLQKNKLQDLTIDNLKNIRNLDDIIAIIPIAREMCVIKKDAVNELNEQGSKIMDDDYSKLTDALHYKKDGVNLSFRALTEVINRYIPLSIDSKLLLEKNYYEYLADSKISINDSLDLPNKLAMAIAIRVELDKLMLGFNRKKDNKLNFNIADGITTNQTRVLYEKFKAHFSEEGKRIIERSFLVTPEYIHFNAFMYEPLIDIPDFELNDLYDEVFTLDSVYS